MLLCNEVPRSVITNTVQKFLDSPPTCRASVTQRQSVWLGIERSRVRNSLRPTGFFFKRGNQSALLGGPVRWECSLGWALTIVRHTPLKCKSEYLVLALGKEIAAQSGVSQAQKSRGIGKWASAATLHSVCPKLSFFSDIFCRPASFSDQDLSPGVRWHCGCNRWANSYERWECGSHADVYLAAWFTCLPAAN